MLSKVEITYNASNSLMTIILFGDYYGYFPFDLDLATILASYSQLKREKFLQLPWQRFI